MLLIVAFAQGSSWMAQLMAVDGGGNGGGYPSGYDQTGGRGATTGTHGGDTYGYATGDGPVSIMGGNNGGNTAGAAQQGSSSSSIPAGAIVIRITPQGLDPQKVTVGAGQQIAWVNETDLPHILESPDQSLKDRNGQPLYTPAIFPQSFELFWLSPNQPSGIYSYTSTTSSDIIGEITVVGMGTGGNQSSARLSDDSDFPVFPVGGNFNEAGSSSERPVFDSAAVSSPASQSSVNPLLLGFSLSAADLSQSIPLPTTLGNQEGLIPVNPYTVGSNRTGPDAVTRPLHEGAPTTPTPNKQPATGSNGWLFALVLSTLFAAGYLLWPSKER